MLHVDLVEELALGVCDVVAPDACAGVDLRRQHLQVSIEQSPLHHPHTGVLFRPISEDEGKVGLLNVEPAKSSLFRLLVEHGLLLLITGGLGLGHSSIGGCTGH